jgi:hypothetical protein
MFQMRNAIAEHSVDHWCDNKHTFKHMVEWNLIFSLCRKVFVKWLNFTWT